MARSDSPCRDAGVSVGLRLPGCSGSRAQRSIRAQWHLKGHDRESYWKLLDDVIVAGHDPSEVVLLEATPELQKTRADFQVYNDRLGVRTVDIAKVRQTGRHLEYLRDGQWTPIRRILNRAIADEMEREGVQPGFDPRSELDVEWAGQPNWYFRARKFSLPFLRHPAVPRAVFLDIWLDDPSTFPLDLPEMLLKPLFSFAGKGIQFAPTLVELQAIPKAKRQLYLLQERVAFHPVISTPLWADSSRGPPDVRVANRTIHAARHQYGPSWPWVDDGGGP